MEFYNTGHRNGSSYEDTADRYGKYLEVVMSRGKDRFSLHEINESLLHSLSPSDQSILFQKLLLNEARLIAKKMNAAGVFEIAPGQDSFFIGGNLKEIIKEFSRFDEVIVPKDVFNFVTGVFDKSAYIKHVSMKNNLQISSVFNEQ